MQIVPLQDRVIVQAVPDDNMSAGGLYLPANRDKEMQAKGLVVAVGPGKQNDDGTRAPMSLKEGDIVLYNRIAGTEVHIGADKVRVIREADAFCILKPSTTSPE